MILGQFGTLEFEVSFWLPTEPPNPERDVTFQDPGFPAPWYSPLGELFSPPKTRAGIAIS